MMVELAPSVAIATQEIVGGGGGEGSPIGETKGEM